MTSPPGDRGLLFSQMDPPPNREHEFHAWYDDEHIPARLALDGFERASRYRAIDGAPSHLACYFLSSLDALETRDYRRLKADPGPRSRWMLENVAAFTRYTCRELTDTGRVDEATGVLSVVAFDVPEDAREPFESWYDEEHVPILMSADGWLRVRRYRVIGDLVGTPWTHLALHELRDAGALDAPERERARSTPRRADLAANEWFQRSGRWLYEPIREHVEVH